METITDFQQTFNDVRDYRGIPSDNFITGQLHDALLKGEVGGIAFLGVNELFDYLKNPIGATFDTQKEGRSRSGWGNQWTYWEVVEKTDKGFKCKKLKSELESCADSITITLAQIYDSRFNPNIWNCIELT